MLTNNGKSSTTASPPAVDVYENKDEILVIADMPGARNESVNVQLDKDELTISAAREGGPEGKLLKGARRDGEYRRTFVIPPGVNPEQISAEMSAGVLTVRLPKTAEMKPRTIPVKPVN